MCLSQYLDTMAQTKATKKFESRHLKDTLKKRKEFAKIKQRHQVNDKRKAKRAQADAEADREKEEQPVPKKQKKAETSLQDMSVDDFFAGGFSVPEPAPAKKASKTVAQDKKRKRSEPAEDVAGSMLDRSQEEPAFGESDVEEDEAEPEDTAIESHVDDLKALAKKDPEFFKYLQENDAELLDFAETAALDEINELSGSEEEGLEKQKKGKKDKSKQEDEGKISKFTVQKWSKAMQEQNSLRSMREIVLAFRAAAHLNEEDGKSYKYTISNAEGELMSLF